MQHQHIITSKLLSQWSTRFPSLLLIATSPYYNVETVERIAWLGIIETEYGKNDNKNHLRIF